jgi:hypothetical protein
MGFFRRRYGQRDRHDDSRSCDDHHPSSYHDDAPTCNYHRAHDEHDGFPHDHY